MLATLASSFSFVVYILIHIFFYVFCCLFSHSFFYHFVCCCCGLDLLLLHLDTPRVFTLALTLLLTLLLFFVCCLLFVILNNSSSSFLYHPPLSSIGRAIFLLSFTTIIDAKEFVFGLELHRNHIKTLTPSTQMDL